MSTTTSPGQLLLPTTQWPSSSGRAAGLTDRLLKAGVFAAVALILFCKAPNLFLRPSLLFEDGRELFSYYYDHREAHSILRPYNGYISLVPNLVGYAAYWGPVRWVPRTYSFFALFCNTLACGIFCTNRFRAILPSDSARTATCLILALMPLEDVAVLSAAMYSLWPLLLLLLLMLLAPFEGNAVVRVGTVVGLSLCICSHPLAVVALPLLIFNCIRYVDWRDRTMNLCLAAVLIAYLLCGTSPGASADWIASLRAAIVLALERIYLESAIGAVRRAAWHGETNVCWMNLALGGACLVWLWSLLWAARAKVDRRLLVPVLILNYLIWALTLASALGRGLDENFLCRLFICKRYTYVQEFCWLLSIAVTAGSLAPYYLSQPAWRRFALGSVLVYATVLSVQNRSLWNFDNKGMAGNAVRQFIRQVEVAASAPDEARPCTLVMERGLWSLRIHLR
jgi:hypothetical protein